MAFKYMVFIDEDCSQCGACFEHFPELRKRLSPQLTAELDAAEFTRFRSRIDWARNLCPEDSFHLQILQ